MGELERFFHWYFVGLCKPELCSQWASGCIQALPSHKGILVPLLYLADVLVQWEPTLCENFKELGKRGNAACFWLVNCYQGAGDVYTNILSHQNNGSFNFSVIVYEVWSFQD